MNGLALCAGIGGIELGLGLASPGYRTVGFVEGYPIAVNVLFKRMNEGFLHKTVLWSDVRSFDPKEMRVSVDIISAGFPCQPWSVAGKQRGIEDERWLWPEIYRIIRQIRPPYVFLENVVGLCNQGLGHVLRDLAQSGYDAEWDVFSARDCEASQLRERLFILAYSPGIHEHRIPTSKREEGNALWEAGDSNTGFQSKREYQLPLWPPSREDLDTWENILTADIAVKPTLCGMVDGISPELKQSVCKSRKERLRALGNAVVPVAEALAFMTLARRASLSTPGIN